MRLHVNDFLISSDSVRRRGSQQRPTYTICCLWRCVWALCCPPELICAALLTARSAIPVRAAGTAASSLTTRRRRSGIPPPYALPQSMRPVSAGRLHLGPAIVETGAGGTLRMSGSLSFADQQANASFNMTAVSVAVLKQAANAWFGIPAALSALVDGSMTGQLSYSYQPGEFAAERDTALLGWSVRPERRHHPCSWSRRSFARVQGRVNFNSVQPLISSDLPATLAGSRLRAHYRYNLLARHTEQVRIEFPAADLSDLQNLFAASDRSATLWARLRFFRRAFPAWLSSRNLEGELRVDHLLANRAVLGTLDAHFLWQGTHLAFNNVALSLPDGKVSASGTVDLASLVPSWNLKAKVSDYSWGGGLVNAEGSLTSSGAGQDVLRNLSAEGSFEGENLSPSPGESFETASGRLQNFLRQRLA